MRNIIILAAVVLLIAGFGSKIADKFGAAPPAPRAPQTVGASNTPRSLTLASDRNGHFQVDARVDGARLPFLVDTGASTVVLRESDAAQAGIHPRPADYSAAVTTANGKVQAAPARLSRVDVGGITVYDVNALVLPDDVLSQNLLGVSFLSRLSRYEYANGRMVLEQ